jgi:hypothetical protein
VLKAKQAITVDLTNAQAQTRDVATIINREGGGGNVLPLPGLAKTLLTGLEMVYQQLKDILGITSTQQVESSLQRRAEVSISTSGRSKAAQELPAVGMASSLAWILAHDWLSDLDMRSKPQVHRQNRQGDEDLQS